MSGDNTEGELPNGDIPNFTENPDSQQDLVRNPLADETTANCYDYETDLRNRSLNSDKLPEDKDPNYGIDTFSDNSVAWKQGCLRC